MQPAKPLAASKKAALASVTSMPRRSSSGRAPGRRRDAALALVEQLDRPASSRPPSARAARRRSGARPSSADGEAERREQVGDDVVVVAGVERDVVAPGLGDGPDDVERLVAVERRDLDRDDVLDLGEAPPERVRQQPAAHRGLEVEADERDDLGDGAAVGDERVVVRVGQRGQAEQPGVVAEARSVRLATGPGRVRPQTPAMRIERLAALRVGAVHLLGGQRQHRLEQADRADRGSRTASCARRPRGRRRRPRRSSGSAPAGAARRASVRVERQRMRGDDAAGAGSQRGRTAGSALHQNRPVPRLEVRRLAEARRRRGVTQSAIHAIICSTVDARRAEQRGSHATRCSAARRRPRVPVNATSVAQQPRRTRWHASRTLHAPRGRRR